MVLSSFICKEGREKEESVRKKKRLQLFYIVIKKPVQGNLISLFCVQYIYIGNFLFPFLWSLWLLLVLLLSSRKEKVL